MLDELARTLAEAGKTSDVLETPDGSRLFVLPYGARVLALCPAEDDESFYWVNPALRDARAARTLLRSEGWHNTGGDRTWLAPELDTFYPDAKLDRYVQPRALDMSDYAVERLAGGMALSRRMTLHLARPDRDVDLRLIKWLGPAANPLRLEREMAALLPGVRYAGYTQRTSLELVGRSAAGAIALGIWNLIQLPPGGELLVPTYRRAGPRHFFGNIPERHLSIEDRLLRLAVDFPHSHKIGLRAAIVCGRAGYAYAQGARWSLVIRNFFVNPSGEYVDVPKPDPADLGYAFQACRVDEADLGSFFELEYHAPALGAPPDPSRSDDVSHVWAFRGDREATDAICHALLGASGFPAARLRRGG